MKKPIDTTRLDEYRRYVREALAEGKELDVDAPTRERVVRSTGWQAGLSLIQHGRPSKPSRKP